MAPHSPGTRIALVPLAALVGALSAGLLFGIASTIYAEIGRSLHPPFEDWGYGIFVGICVLAAATGGAIAGVAAVLVRGKARFLIPALLGAGAGMVFSITESSPPLHCSGNVQSLTRTGRHGHPTNSSS
jgi:hypothetical protein